MDGEQWTLKITKYAGRLLKDLDKLDWPEKIKNAQEKWIGESVGHTVVFECSSDKTLPSISTFTTRVETLPGVTFLSYSTRLANTFWNNKLRKFKKLSTSITLDLSRASGVHTTHTHPLCIGRAKIYYILYKREVFPFFYI